MLINSGVGDHEQYVRSRKVGVVVEQFSRSAFNSALDSLFELLRDSSSSLAARCHAVAEEDFSLTGAVESYLELYRWLSGEENR